MAYLTNSAEHVNQYAQYILGKLYLTGQGVKQDREQAWGYFYESAEQGNEYADFFLEHFDQARRPKAGNRTVLLPAPVLKVLKAYQKTVHSRWMFPSPVKEDSPMDPAAVRKRLQTVLERAECKRLRFHDLRHTFATASLEHGMDIKTLSTIIGHVSSTTTLNTYTHVTDAMRQNAADKIDRGIGRAESKPRQESAPQKPVPSTFQAHKGQRRKPGTGCVSQINGHLWEGRYSPIVNGKRMARNIYAKTEEECEEKLAELIREMKAEIAAGKKQAKQKSAAS